MAIVTGQDKDAFFADANEAAKKSIWAAIATVDGDQARVRIVHPTWENDVLWFATGTTTAKARQIASNASVDVQWQVGPPDFIHLLVRGTATLLDDQATKDHVWDVLDYDLAQFWPGGSTDPNYIAVKIVPERVELSAMFGTSNKRVWQP